MSKPKYIKRLLEKKILKYAREFPIVVLSGPRQSGKSTTLKNLFSETHQYITFDNPLTRDKCKEDPKLFLDNLAQNVIFDEIQYVPELLSYLKILVDENRRKYGRFIITGSQQFSLIKNLGDTLAGRAGLLTLLPFNYLEEKNIISLRKTINNSYKMFLFSCLKGSFPEIATRINLDSFDWYSSYLQTYLERDVRGLHNIGNIREFQRFLQLLASRSSCELNLSYFALELGVAVNTIKSWVSILSSSNIIFLLPPYSRNLGKRIVKNPKVYFVDCGLICFLTGIKTKEMIINGPISGQLFENYVISEIYKIFYSKGESPNLFFLRTHKGMEIDLIIEKGLKVFPIEIKLTKNPKKEMVSSIEKFYQIDKGIESGDGKLVCLSDENFNLTKKTTIEDPIKFFESL